MANDKLIEKIKEIHAELEGKYGSPRIYQELQRKKISCSENRVARLMRKTGLRAKKKRLFRMKTKANAARPVTPNLFLLCVYNTKKISIEFITPRANRKG